MARTSARTAPPAASNQRSASRHARHAVLRALLERLNSGAAWRTPGRAPSVPLGASRAKQASMAAQAASLVLPSPPSVLPRAPAARKAAFKSSRVRAPATRAITCAPRARSTRAVGAATLAGAGAARQAAQRLSQARTNAPRVHRAPRTTALPHCRAQSAPRGATTTVTEQRAASRATCAAPSGRSTQSAAAALPAHAVHARLGTSRTLLESDVVPYATSERTPLLMVRAASSVAMGAMLICRA